MCIAHTSANGKCLPDKFTETTEGQQMIANDDYRRNLACNGREMRKCI